MNTPNEQNADYALPARWPRKPPKDARCDASVGWHTDPFGAPVIDRCPNKATETAILRRPTRMEMWLCDGCVGPLASAGTVDRNPRRPAHDGSGGAR